jgi:hypothetical protein
VFLVTSLIEVLREMPRGGLELTFVLEWRPEAKTPESFRSLPAMMIRAVFLGMMFCSAVVHTFELLGLCRAANVRTLILLDVGAVVRDAGTLQVSAASRGLDLVIRYRVFL